MIIIMLGAPGSGKGTQSEKIVKKYGFGHISTGDLLRDEIKKESELGKVVKGIMDKGEFVSDDIMIKIIESKLTDSENRGKTFILDGFPRNVNQAQKLDEILSKNGLAIGFVINMQVSDEELVERLTARLYCSVCKKTYNLLFSPPTLPMGCDVCGGKLMRRDDDKEETVRNRLSVYDQQTKPLIEFYTRKGIMKNFVGTGKMPEAIFEEIKVLFE